MTAVTATTLSLACLPFLLSLAGEGSKVKIICLIAGACTLLLGAEPDRAGLAWVAGMAIALDAVWERIRPALPGLASR